MMKSACLVLGLLLVALPVGGQTDEHFYSPETNLELSEFSQLETATRTVDVAMYSFTDKYLAAELATLARKGVRVRVYRGREQFSREAQWRGIATTSILLAAGSRRGSKAQGVSL